MTNALKSFTPVQFFEVATAHVFLGHLNLPTFATCGVEITFLPTDQAFTIYDAIHCHCHVYLSVRGPSKKPCSPLHFAVCRFKGGRDREYLPSRHVLLTVALEKA